MDKTILRRIEELERQRPSSIICLARNLKTGKQQKMPMRELAEKYMEWDLVKVLDGNDMDDLGAYLDSIKKYVEERHDEQD